MSDLIARLTACSPLNIALAHEARDEIERLKAQLAGQRMCVNCGRYAPEGHDRSQPLPECVDANGLSACTFDVTPQEACRLWRDRYYEKRVEIERLQADLDDTNRIFEMHWDCSMRAIRMWQAANPGNDLVWPDAADLLVWLLDQHKNQRDEIARLRNALNATEGQ